MKTIRATINEFVKLFSKKSTFIILILTLLLSAAVPVITYYQIQDMSFQEQNYAEYLESEKTSLENSLESLNAQRKKSKNKKFLPDIIYTKASLEQVNMRIEAQLKTWSDWREGKSWELNQYIVEKNIIYYYIKKNKNAIKELEAAGAQYQIDQEAYNYYLTKNSTKKLKTRYDKLTAIIKDFKTAIFENNPDYFNQLQLKNEKSSISFMEKQIKQLNKDRKKANKEGKKVIDAQLKELKSEVARAKDYLIWTQYRADNNISLQYDDWKFQCMDAINQAMYVRYERTLTREEYDEQGGFFDGGMYREIVADKDVIIDRNRMSYEQYLADLQKRKAEAEDNIIFYAHSLEQNIPPMKFTQDTRVQLQQISFVITLVSFAMLMIAAPITSSEYSKGTIRLLLTRPVKRYKIIISKILTILLLTVIMFVLCAVIFAVTTIGLFGKEAFEYPVFTVSQGVVQSNTIMQIILPVLLKSTVVILFIVSLSLAFTTIFKSSVLAVGIPMGILAFSSIVSTRMLYSGYHQVLKWTIFPYIQLPDLYNKTGIYQYLSEFFPTADLNPVFGFYRLLIPACALILLNIWVFSKRDVKN